MSIEIKAENRGKLHKRLGIKGKIPLSALMGAKHAKDPAEREEAQFAINARSWGHA